jgi:hypothetical protein
MARMGRAAASLQPDAGFGGRIARKDSRSAALGRRMPAMAPARGMTVRYYLGTTRIDVGEIFLPGMHRTRPASSEGEGSVCVAPISKDWPPTAGTEELACPSNEFSLRIDAQKAIPSPNKESIKIDGSDFNMRHRIVVCCAGEPQQSFGFRFSEFKTAELCLFLNDLYKAAQLWDSTQMPASWCKCK